MWVVLTLVDGMLEEYSKELAQRVAERYSELLSRNAPVDTGALRDSFRVVDEGDESVVVGLYYGKYVDDNYIRLSQEELMMDLENGFY